MKGFVLRLFFSSQTEAHSVPNLIFWSPSYGGSYKITVICLSVCPSVVQHFYQKWVGSFFRFFAPWLMIGIFQIWQSPFFGKIPQIWAKIAQNGSKIVFFYFLKNVVISFPGNDLKWKLVFLFIFHQSTIW